MDSIRDVLLPIETFTDLTTRLIDKSTIELAKSVIQSLHATNIVKPKDLLSAFLIYKFPEDTVGSRDNVTNQNTIDYACLLVEADSTQLANALIKFSYHFNVWKQQDIKTLKEQLFHEYHQLSVDILNEENPEKVTIYELTQNEILKCAHNVGGTDFVSEIQQYKPIVVSKEQVVMMYNQAYLDLFSEEFSQKNFDKTRELLNMLKEIFLYYFPDQREMIEDSVDIDFIIQRFSYDAYNPLELQILCRYLYNKLCDIPGICLTSKLDEVSHMIDSDTIHFPTVLFWLIREPKFATPATVDIS